MNLDPATLSSILPWVALVSAGILYVAVLHRWRPQPKDLKRDGRPHWWAARNLLTLSALVNLSAGLIMAFVLLVEAT